MKLIALITAVAVACVGCAHTQRPESGVYVVSENAEGLGSALATGGSGGHDCQQEHVECMQRCWDNRYPWPHSDEQSGWYHERCITKCREQFAECDKEQEQALREKEKKLNFSSMERAIDWINRHKGELTAGAIVVVAGVSYVLLVTPPGLLILATVATAAAAS